jgi:hypothetical protein
MYIYIPAMDTSTAPETLLEQIRQIQHMEHGSLSIMGQGPNGPYFNLNSWEQEKNCCRYVPGHKVPAVRQAIEGYRKFQQLTAEYAQQVIEKNRAELAIGVKKKKRRPAKSPPASS